MSRRLVFVIVAGFSLGGCCLESGRYIQPPAIALTSWDGLGPRPTRHRMTRAKVRKTSVAVAAAIDSPNEEELSKLKPYSREWGVVLDAMNRAADDKLKKQLIICRGCMPSEPDDQTGSITSNH
jgi:hypothetical protein